MGNSSSYTCCDGKEEVITDSESNSPSSLLEKEENIENLFQRDRSESFIKLKKKWDENNLPIRHLSFITNNPVYRGMTIPYSMIFSTNNSSITSASQPFASPSPSTSSSLDISSPIGAVISSSSNTPTPTTTASSSSSSSKTQERFFWVNLSKKSLCKSKHYNRYSKHYEILLKDITHIEVLPENSSNEFEMVLSISNDKLILKFQSIELRDLWESELCKLKLDPKYLIEYASKDF